METLRTALAVIFCGLCSAALAQTPGLGESRPVAPAPGEKAPAAQDAQKPAPERARALRRCDELAGTLREDCLRENREQEGNAAAGATRRPEPPTAPPPQNPIGR